MKATILSVFTLAATCILFSGCTTDQISRNVYEGTKNRNEALRSAPPDSASPRVPGYDEFERERRGL